MFLQDSGECQDECHFCQIHKYGFFVVLGLGVVIFLVIICIYRREVCAYFAGDCRRSTLPFQQEVIDNSPPVDNFYNQRTVSLGQPLNTVNPPVMLQPILVASPYTQNQSLSKTVKTSTEMSLKTEDPFQLPKPEGLQPHVSTGSNYFRQMMRGKKPVTSISEYAIRKPKGRENKHQHHHHHCHHHHHHHNKDKEINKTTTKKLSS